MEISGQHYSRKTFHRAQYSGISFVILFLANLIKYLEKWAIVKKLASTRFRPIVFSIGKTCTLQDTVPKIWNRYSQKWNCTASFPIPALMYCIWEGFIYSHHGSAYFSSGPIVGIYKSLTDTWMLKLAPRPHSFISGNTWIGSSMQCSVSGQYSLYCDSPWLQ